MHARAEFDPSNEATTKALECANHLLKTKQIDRVFFSSENQRLSDLAESMIKPSYALVSIEKKYINETKNAPPDKERSVRPRYVERGTVDLEDWYILGEAHYCMTPTPKSSFSTTALMRTECRYVPYSQGGNCNVTEKLFYIKPKNMLIMDKDALGSKKVDIDKFWNKVSQEKVSIKFNAVQQTTIESLRKFWLKAPSFDR